MITMKENNGKLIVENSKKGKETRALTEIIIPVLSIAFIVWDKKTTYVREIYVYEKFILFCACILPLIIIFISNAKVITMDGKGCSVELMLLGKFSVYEKSYLWNELSVYITGYYEGSTNILNKGVVLSNQRFSFPKKMRLDIYSEIHPLSFFYFSIKENNVNIHNSVNATYEVDADLFREKMAEWGVEISETIPWL